MTRPEDREQFEAWWASKHPLANSMNLRHYFKTDGSGFYGDAKVQWQWEAWQARAALPATVALPPYIYGREAGPNERVWTEDAIRAAIEAASRGTGDAWQLITEDQRPPSDTAVLLFSPDRGPTNDARIEACVFHNSRGGSLHAWATHWMPLPAPPTSAHPGAGGT